MNIITVDFETYYDKEFSLSKLTTEEYVRSDKFEVIGVGVKVNDEETEWFSGSHAEIQKYFKKFDWKNSLVLAHNTAFDGAILSWRFGIRPKGWLDTLCMARALNGVDAGGSLAKLAQRYNLGEKGTEVTTAIGMRLQDFSPGHLKQYGEYCKNDVELTYNLFNVMMFPVTGLGGGAFPQKELKVIDITLRMFIEPTLELNTRMLNQHLSDVVAYKERLLAAAESEKDLLMSNDKFAELLSSLGVEPPKKISPKTGREAWAFAKTDEAFKALADHENVKVQALVAARLGNKSTLEETRTQRFIDIASRGLLPVPIKYYAAHTGRWGGDDKINLQNLPSRGQNGGKLKSAICAPPGFVLIDADSSQIEARIVAWVSGQADLVDFFEKNNAEIAAGVPKDEMKYDPYKIMAAQIYGKGVDQIDKNERFVGKTTILGAGYGMGAMKFQAQLKAFGVDMSLDECQRIIKVYRTTYSKIPELWAQGQTCLGAILSKSAAPFGAVGIPEFDASEKGFLLPSGLWQRYEGLRCLTDADGRLQYEYQTRRGMVKLYGGKLVENICQALAKCVIAEQMMRIARKYKPVLTVHDAIMAIAPETEKEEAAKYIEDAMRWRPDWCKDLPLNCEYGVGYNYGEC